jgi:hypothetical protein
VNLISSRTKQEAFLRVRPAFVLVCVAVLFVIFVPDVIARRLVLQRLLLVLAAIAIGLGWFFLLNRQDHPNGGWRAWTSLVTAAYLTASIPTVFFELSQGRWLRYPAASMYVRPWVHWSYSLLCLGILGSFVAQGRARMALVVGSIALLILRASMGAWVF